MVEGGEGVKFLDFCGVKAITNPKKYKKIKFYHFGQKHIGFNFNIAH